MKKNIILLLCIINLFFSIGVCADQNGRASNRMDFIVLEFSKTNKRIWLDGTTVDEIGFSSASNIEKKMYGFLVIKINGATKLNLRSIKIETNDIDVFINGTPMGKNMNAVISRNDEISLGAYIRTFE